MDHVDPAAISDPALRTRVVEFLTLLNTQANHLQELRAENQRLRDEIARLKGEQGHPNVRLPAPPDWRTPKSRQPCSKQAHLTSTHKKLCRLARATLPPDAQFKGYHDGVGQDLPIDAATIRFHKEKFYSPVR